jgi:RimJ/RimL family protein N-acetyltransferase
MMHHVHRLTMQDGLTVRVRPLRPGDIRYLVELYDHMSDVSRASRFRQSDIEVERGTVWEQATEIAEVPYPEGFGLIAFGDLPKEPHAAVGVVRYRLSPPDEAEVSISIRDDMQRQGLGTQLIFLIREYARQHGIRKLFGLTRSDSRFLQRLLRKEDLPLEIIPQGEFTYIAHYLDQEE